MLILCATALAFAAYVCIAQELQLFERDPQTDGYECHESDYLLLTTQNSYIRCAAQCWATNKCKRMFYNASTKQCIGCSTIRYQLTESAGSLSYIAVPTTKYMSYLGCFLNRRNVKGRYEYRWSSSMTNEECFEYCILDKGYRYMETEDKYLCFCGNSYEAYALLPDSDCSAACGGDNTQMCGSAWALSIYSY